MIDVAQKTIEFRNFQNDKVPLEVAAGHSTTNLTPKQAWAPQKQLTHQMREQARQRQEVTVLPPSSEKLFWTHHPSHIMLPRPPHRQKTLQITRLTQCTAKRMSPVVTFKLQVRGTFLHTEFIGNLVLVNCCPFEGGDVGKSMHWHTECSMKVMLRSRERLEARCEELKLQTSNYFGNHDKAPVGRGGSDKAFVVQGELRMALRQLRQEEEELQPGRKKLLPPGWKRFRVEEIKDLLWNGISHFVDSTASPSEGGIDSRLATLVRETDRSGNGPRLGRVQQTCRSMRRPGRHRAE